MQRIDVSAINLSNKVKVLNILWENGYAYRAEIARMTDLSQPTVMKIIDEFKNLGLVNITGKGVSSGGKPPLMLQFNKDAYYIIGVDINEYRIEIILMDLSFSIVDKVIQDNRDTDTPDSILNRVIYEIKSLIQKNADKEDRIIGIGLGIAGLVNRSKGIVTYASELGWHNVNVLKYFEKSFDAEIVIDDSTRAFALEEKLFGRGKGINNFLCLNLGTGIGSALVMDSKLYYGGSQSSCQIGHMTVELNGEPCFCGNSGCLTLHASGEAITKAAKEYAMSHRNSKILDLVYGDINKIDLNIVFEAAKNGDKEALDIIEEAANYLGMAVASVINLVDPELIICEGKISRLSNIYMDNFKKAISQRKMQLIGRDVEIVVADDKSCSGSIGAAAFIFNNFIKRGGEIESIVKIKKNNEEIGSESSS